MQRATGHLKVQEGFHKGGDFPAPGCHTDVLPTLSGTWQAISKYVLNVIEHSCHSLLKDCQQLNSGYKNKPTFFSQSIWAHHEQTPFLSPACLALRPPDPSQGAHLSKPADPDHSICPGCTGTQTSTSKLGGKEMEAGA